MIHKNQKNKTLIILGVFTTIWVLFLWFYRISLINTFYMSIYIVFLFFLPALFLIASSFREISPEQTRLHGALIALNGFLIIFISYMSAVLTHVEIFAFLPLLAYLLVLKNPTRERALHIIKTCSHRFISQNSTNQAILLGFIVITFIFFLLPRPTPGFTEVYYYPDYMFFGGIAASLTHSFPPLSFNVFEMPEMTNYHFLLFCITAHISMVTKLPIADIILQQIFILLLPLLGFSLFSIIRRFTTSRFYTAWGMALFFFGTGFIELDWYFWVLTSSESTLLGLIILLLLLIILSEEGFLLKREVVYVLSFGVLLLTFAKGPAGFILFLGVTLWMALMLITRNFRIRDLITWIVISTSFVITYITLFSGGAVKFPFYPFDSILYMRNIDYNNSSPWYIVIIVIITLLQLFSYRITGILYFWDRPPIKANRFQYLLLMVVFSSFILFISFRLTYAMLYYFVFFGLAILNILVLGFVEKINLIERIKNHFLQKQYIIAIMLSVFLIIPFAVDNPIHCWASKGGIINLYVANRFATAQPLLPGHVIIPEPTNIVEPDLYEALMYIRNNSLSNVTVISPFYKEPRQFMTSCFTERVVFFEKSDWPLSWSFYKKFNSEFYNKVLNGIYDRGEIPEYLMSRDFVLLYPISDVEEINLRYHIVPSFRNNTWVVYTFE